MIILTSCVSHKEETLQGIITYQQIREYDHIINVKFNDTQLFPTYSNQMVRVQLSSSILQGNYIVFPRNSVIIGLKNRITLDGKAFYEFTFNELITPDGRIYKFDTASGYIHHRGKMIKYIPKDIVLKGGLLMQIYINNNQIKWLSQND